MKMFSRVDKTSERRSEFDKKLEKYNIDLTSPALVEEALRLEKLISEKK